MGGAEKKLLVRNERRKEQRERERGVVDAQMSDGQSSGRRPEPYLHSPTFTPWKSFSPPPPAYLVGGARRALARSLTICRPPTKVKVGPVPKMADHIACENQVGHGQQKTSAFQRAAPRVIFVATSNILYNTRQMWESGEAFGKPMHHFSPFNGCK